MKTSKKEQKKVTSPLREYIEYLLAKDKTSKEGK